MFFVFFSLKTCTDWASFCREVCFDAAITHRRPNGGPNKIVEIDESKFGRRKYHRSHRVEGQWVFGGVERESGRVVMVPVERRDKETLLQLIKEWILPGTTIHSDCWKANNCLNDEGYRHLSVNHSLHFKDPATGVHTNTNEARIIFIQKTRRAAGSGGGGNRVGGGVKEEGEGGLPISISLSLFLLKRRQSVVSRGKIVFFL